MSDTLEKPPAPASEYSWWLPRHPKSAGFARRLLRTFLAKQPGGEPFRDTGELVLGELVANAVLHARTPPGRLIFIRFDLHPASLRIEVHDADSAPPPAPRPAHPDDQTGRGLWLVSQLASDWGCSPRPGGIGKVVWARLDGGAR
ncbi:ATP-binding protein [Kitasatospora sp. NPDC048194]|uniref:ATP-binding protein n=1 Tax=Kitasatospora sp. NPDC048194 TaxID=3364045 RepID=UPI00371A1F64